MSDYSSIEVDDKKVLDLFKELDYKKQIKSYKQALRISARIIQKEAKASLKKEIGKSANQKGRYGRLNSGIKIKVARNGMSAKVHIMGDFRLKFFELGTDDRYIRKNNAYRGKMNATHFFQTARKAKEEEAENSLLKNLEKAIIKINEKHK